MPLQAHQIEAAKFLIERNNGLVAYDMGTGKTRIGLAYANYKLKNELTDVVIIVTSTNLLSSWKEEIAACFRSYKVHLYHGTKRKRILPLSRKVFLTTYDLIKRDIDRFCRRFDGVRLTVICDEVHNIKTPGGERVKAINDLDADTRVGLTGTPISNKPEDLFAIVNWIAPEVTGDDYDLWVDQFCKVKVNMVKIKRRNGQRFNIFVRKIVGYKKEAIPMLHELLKDVMIRKLKKDCYDLPEKRVIFMGYDLDKSKSNYRKLVHHMVDDEFPVSVVITKLQQMLSGLNPLSENQNGRYTWIGSDKFNLLKELVEESDGRLIIWCKYLDTAYSIYKHFKRDGKEVFWHTGGMTRETKDKNISGWKASENGILVPTIKSAGTGLNLTEASTAIVYEAEFSPSANAQAEDRIHRFGQENHVTIYYLYGYGTVEQGIIDLYKKKKQTNDAVIDGFTQKDLENIAGYRYNVGNFKHEKKNRKAF